MSQVSFKTTMTDPDEGKVAVEVMGGWDRPLREFFLAVRPLDSIMDGIYSGSGFDPEALVEDMTEMTGLTVPTEFMELMARREGNMIYRMREENGNVYVETFAG